MGYALIVGGGADGRYTISLDIGEAERAALVERFTAQAAEAQANLATAQATLNDKSAELATAAEAYDAATLAYIEVLRGDFVPDSGDELLQIVNGYKEAQAEYITALTAHAVALQNKNALSFSAATINKALAGWQAQILTETRDAWCTDYTEDATGYVATMEIPGESDLILIAPGGRQPVLAADGQLRSRGLMSPWQAYMNAAMLPGWQKFKPTYRWGTVTALDEGADTASVALVEARSSAQRLLVNQSNTLVNVPVVYMECNAAAFEVGDRVVVEFQAQDWARPRVIGFLDNPRACNWVMIGGAFIGVGRLSPIFAAFSENSYDIFSSATVDGRVNRGEWTALNNDFPGGDSEFFYTLTIGSYEAAPGIIEDFGLSIVILKPIGFASLFPSTPPIDGATAYAYFSFAGPTGNYGPRPLSKFEIRARAPDQTLLLNLATLEIGWAGEFIPPTGKSTSGFKQRDGYVAASVLDYQLFSETGD